MSMHSDVQYCEWMLPGASTNNDDVPVVVLTGTGVDPTSTNALSGDKMQTCRSMLYP